MKRNSGFSYVEIMVCVVILSTGLLGLMGLQARGLKNNVSGYQRTQATLLAYNIIDRMRANARSQFVNVAGELTYKPENSKYVTQAISDGTAPDEACQPAVAAGDVPADSCGHIKMAVYDLVQWNRELTAQYCNGATTVVCNGVALGEVNYNLATDTYTVIISWDENRNDVVDNRDPINPANACFVKNTDMPALSAATTHFDPCFRTDFQL